MGEGAVAAASNLFDDSGAYLLHCSEDLIPAKRLLVQL